MDVDTWNMIYVFAVLQNVIELGYLSGKQGFRNLFHNQCEGFVISHEGDIMTHQKVGKMSH